MTDAARPARPEYGEYDASGASAAAASAMPARPERPEYGEYATPEEVAELMGTVVPHPDAPPAATPFATSTPAPAIPDDARTGSVDAASLTPPSAADRMAGRPPVPAWDRPIAVGLLTAGVLNLLLSTPAYLQFAEIMTQAVASMPDPSVYGGITFGSTADTAGTVILVAQSVILIVSIGIVVRRARLGRRVFWIPLLGAVVSGIAFLVPAGIAFGIAMANG